MATNECGTPAAAADGQPLERGKALAEDEAGGGVGGVEARDAAVDQQAAERDDEGLHVEPGDQQPVRQPDQHAERQHQQRRQPARARRS